MQWNIHNKLTNKDDQHDIFCSGCGELRFKNGLAHDIGITSTRLLERTYEEI